MPLVRISYSPYLGIGLLEKLALALPQIVADELGEPETQAVLVPDDIEIESRQFRTLNYENHQGKLLEIFILANDYPERRKNFHERRHRIVEKIRNLFGDRKPPGFVWVLLVPGSFEEL